MVRFTLAAMLSAVLVAPVLADDAIPVSGSSTRYPVAVSTEHNQQRIIFKLTGVALRTKAIFNVYTIGSYLQDGIVARSADELIALDAAKLLCITLERDVSGPELIDAFKTAVAKTHPGKFGDEFAKLARQVGSDEAKKGSEVVIAYLPGTGTRFTLVGKPSLIIPGKEFATALWEIYLGPNPVTDKIKQGLSSRLGR